MKNCERCNSPVDSSRNLQNHVLCPACETVMSQALEQDMVYGGNWTGMTGLEAE